MCIESASTHSHPEALKTCLTLSCKRYSNRIATVLTDNDILDVFMHLLIKQFSKHIKQAQVLPKLMDLTLGLPIIKAIVGR
jgi:hypothetical protein